MHLLDLMCIFFYRLLIAAAAPVFASTTTPQSPTTMMQSSWRFAAKQAGFVSRLSCTRQVSKRKCTVFEQIHRTSLAPTMSVHQKHSNFHTSTMLMMGAKRKKNGGKRKKVEVATLSKTAAKKLAANQLLSQEIDALDRKDDLTLAEIFAESEEAGDRSVSTEFATEYHAPVMPKECIEALLKQGMWAELLEDKKNRWRKKRSIVEAKRRRLGYIDEINEEESYATTSKVDEPLHVNIRPRLFIDGTLGGGGHSQAILEQLNPGDVLIGCDVDPEALSTASNRLVDYLGTREYILDRYDEGAECLWEESRPMFIPVQSNFRSLISVLSKVRHPKTGRLLLGNRDASETNSDVSEENELEFPAGANGMLLDLGVSSHQIDTPDRGFAFMKDGPLDMRMSGNSLISSRTASSSLTAADIVNEFDEPSIISILQTFGDEPRARRIASAIVGARPLYSTTDLVHAINSVTPTFARQKRAGLIATSARVFQALRIAVNEEDAALRDVLEKVAPWALARSGGMMKAGDAEESNEGMLVVLSYHSMEDKMTKRVMRDGSVNFLDGHRGRGGALERDIFGNVIGKGDGGELDRNMPQLPFEPLGKPQKATDEEIAVNSRARSATLRVGIRN